MISNNSKPWTGSPGDECAICLCDNDSDSLTLPCGHSYHRACLEALIKSSAKTYLECPTCKKVYGTKTGNMPTTGKIRHILTNHRLPGYENCGCIEITYYFSPGIQVAEKLTQYYFRACSISRVLNIPNQVSLTIVMHFQGKLTCQTTRKEKWLCMVSTWLGTRDCSSPLGLL